MQSSKLLSDVQYPMHAVLPCTPPAPCEKVKSSTQSTGKSESIRCNDPYKTKRKFPSLFPTRRKPRLAPEPRSIFVKEIRHGRTRQRHARQNGQRVVNAQVLVKGNLHFIKSAELFSPNHSHRTDFLRTYTNDGHSASRHVSNERHAG